MRLIHKNAGSSIKIRKIRPNHENSEDKHEIRIRNKIRETAVGFVDWIFEFISFSKAKSGRNVTIGEKRFIKVCFGVHI